MINRVASSSRDRGRRSLRPSCIFEFSYARTCTCTYTCILFIRSVTSPTALDLSLSAPLVALFAPASKWNPRARCLASRENIVEGTRCTGRSHTEILSRGNGPVRPPARPPARPPVRSLVRPSARPSVRPSIRPAGRPAARAVLVFILFRDYT